MHLSNLSDVSRHNPPQVGGHEPLEGLPDHQECRPRPEEPESGLAEEGGEPGANGVNIILENDFGDNPPGPHRPVTLSSAHVVQPQQVHGPGAGGDLDAKYV